MPVYLLFLLRCLHMYKFNVLSISSRMELQRSNSKKKGQRRPSGENRSGLIRCHARSMAPLSGMVLEALPRGRWTTDQQSVMITGRGDANDRLQRNVGFGKHSGSDVCQTASMQNRVLRGSTLLLDGAWQTTVLNYVQMPWLGRIRAP